MNVVLSLGFNDLTDKAVAGRETQGNRSEIKTAF